MMVETAPDRAKDIGDLGDVAYVMTHYPRVALTFISGEIDAVARLGVRVVPIAINLPEAADVPTKDAQRRADATLYLKASRGRIAVAVLATLLAHPWQMIRLIAKAARSGRADLDVIARRLVHLAYAAVVARHCRTHAIRHLHAHFGLAPATIAWFAAEIMNFSDAPRARWSFTIHGFQDFVNETIARLDLKAASAAFVVCVSDFTRSQLCRIADPADWSRFHVVRCGIDLDAFAMRGQAPARPSPRIVVVGRLSPEKGHLTLLQAVRILVDHGVDARLEIVGAGPFEAAIRREAERLALTSHVSYTGELLPADVRARLEDADIFCMPSFSEGLPISLMEAMALGVPAVTTWISGIPELAEPGTAVTVAPGNPEALAAGLRQLASDRALRERIAANARAAVERMHSVDASARTLVALFGQARADAASEDGR